MKESIYFISILIAISFSIILIFNSKFSNKIIKYSFLFFSLIFLILIFILDSNFIYEFLKAIITYLWYPNYLIFVISIIFSIILFIVNILKKEKMLIKNILTYLMFSICLACYIIFLSLDIDVSLYSDLYQSNSLVLMRTVSISFIIYIISLFILRLRGKNEG